MWNLEIIKSFFDKEFFQNLIGALIGTGTAILIFYMTISSDKKKEKKKNHEADLNRITHFSNLVNSSISHIEIIIQNLQDVIQKYEDGEIKFQLLRFSPDKSLIRLEELLKNENYMLSFVSVFGKDNISKFNNISREVDFFNMQIEQILDILKISQKFDYERKNDFRAKANELLQISVSLTNKENFLTAEHIQLLESIIEDFYVNTIDPTDLKLYYDFTINILEKILINYIENQQHIIYIEKFRNTSILFNEIINQINHHKEDLEQIKNTMQKILNSYKTDTLELIRIDFVKSKE